MSIRFKLVGFIGLILGAVYLLLPTGLLMQPTTQSLRNQFANLLPSKELNLGLDLRGGMYLELSVQVEQAVAHQIDIMVADLTRYVQKSTPEVQISKTENQQIQFIVPVEKSDAVKSLLVDYFGNQNMSLKDLASQGTFILELSSSYLAMWRGNIIEQAANAVRNRIDRFGVVEAAVSRQGGDRLVIELPGVKDSKQVIDIIKRTGKLEFRKVSKGIQPAELTRLINEKVKTLELDRPYEGEALNKLNQALSAVLPEQTQVYFGVTRDALGKVQNFNPYLLENEVTVTGDMLENASVQAQDNQPYVSMNFDKTGTKLFGELTTKNIGEQVAIVLDNFVMSAPVIRGAITGGQASIELGYGRYNELLKEAKDLVLVLKEGALPAALVIDSQNLIGPSLGKESIHDGVRALLMASLAVVLFMMVYYRMGGLIANIALFVNVLFIFAILTLMGASLTLPGIAGIVLTLGMAVDANVIIFERMREELFLGHDVRTVVASGYNNAMSAIVDSNITTFISGLVLFEFGTGPIKGFATTLMVGIVTTMVTAIVLTRLMYDIWLAKRGSTAKLFI